MRRAIVTTIVAAALCGQCHAGWVTSGGKVSAGITVKNEGNLQMVIDKTEATVDRTMTGHINDGRIDSVIDTQLAVGVTQVSGYGLEYEVGEADDFSWGVKITRKSDGAVAHLAFGSTDYKQPGSKDGVACGKESYTEIFIPTEYHYVVACATRQPGLKINFHTKVGSKSQGQPWPTGEFRMAVTGAVINS
ncbi:hypothetical protein [Escherichia coli]|uniref:hypothetical protein n=1 Tax=Escherichia coli TaxID=562 RepID=UPI00135D1737|nr:hypothetical protein [Escherichia coli]MXF08899.1 hypothetical protein [Escherichia coli]